MLAFNDLKNELRKFVFAQIRADEQDYFEGVISKDELLKLTPALEKIFGPPVSSQQSNLSVQLQAKIKEMGGVMEGQGLYALSAQEVSYCAMLWPWGNGLLITIKVCKV